MCKGQRQIAPSAHACLDDEVNAGRTPRLQRARVAELEAKINTRRGRSGGAFHCKGAAVNRRCLYTGSPNDDVDDDDDDDDDNIS